MVQANNRIGPYTLISKLGRGTFGVVWLAEKRTRYTSTKFALKLPRDEDIDVEAIKQEAKLWEQACGHPNVLPIIEADDYDGQIVIVSEYAPDGSLSKWMEKHGGRAPSIEAAVEITLGILAGLEHLHERKIIHRDLKPDNILLQGQIPRLADFGIARVLKTTDQSSGVSGTPIYMAPEAFDGKRSRQTDLWAVGVILFQLLTGSLPFSQADIASLLGAIIAREPEPLSSIVPHAIQEVVRKSLQKEPLQRYQSAREMQKALLNVNYSQAPSRTDEIEIGFAPTITFQSPLNTPFPKALSPTIPSSGESTDSATSVTQLALLPQTKRQTSKFWLSLAIVLLMIGAGISSYLLLNMNLHSKYPSASSPAYESAKPIQPKNMILIPGGTFQMGRNDGRPWEAPVHQIEVQSFYIDRTEVTNAEYGEFVSQTKHLPPMDWVNQSPPVGQEKWPVAYVTLEDARAFAAWRSKRDGVSYRLPTEEEWEFAARNRVNDLYPWGNNLREDVAVIKETGVGSRMPVGSKPDGATYQGVFDMIGNVWEWTSTQASLYPASGLNLQDSMKDSFIVRGGGYDTHLRGKERVTATTREWLLPSYTHSGLGFRLVRTAL
jgi:formylglycine-generating enzyme required for sulfatase activity/tRNA A-37 threonylcarbamoyl transferase component Bud32